MMEKNYGKKRTFFERSNDDCNPCSFASHAMKYIADQANKRQRQLVGWKTK